MHRRKRSTTIAVSSDVAILLDGVEQTLGDGPCLESVETLKPVLLPNTGHDQRWPALSKNLAAAGARSVHGVPLDLGKDASAALNFFALDTGLYTDEAIEEAVIFADMASQALRLAIRIATSDLLAEDHGCRYSAPRRQTPLSACYPSTGHDPETITAHE